MVTPIRIGAIAGEYMESVLVVAWHAKVGDHLREGAPLLTVETAKAATEVPAPCSGVLTAISASPGAEVPVETVLGLIGSAAGEAAVAPSGPPSQAAATAGRAATTPGRQRPPAGNGRLVASPFARRQAALLGVALAAVQPSSPTGRIKARDVRAAKGAAAARAAGGPLAVQRLRVGEGAPLVALHGFTADANAWRPLLRVLPGVAVTAIELPAHGGSPRDVPADFAALASTVIAAFDTLGLRRVRLVGHSLGGALALTIAEARPKAVASLALIAPAGLGPDVAGDCIAGVARASEPASLGPWLKVMVGDPALASHDFVRAAMSLRADPGLRAAQAVLMQKLFPDGTQAFDVGPALAHLACPARIIWGRADRVIPWRHGTRAPGHVGLHLLDGVGHLPHIEAPVIVARIIDELHRGEGPA